MNNLINGTKYANTARGMVLVRGARELHLIGVSVAQTTKARELASSHSFDKLYKKARRAPGMSGVKYLIMKGN